MVQLHSKEKMEGKQIRALIVFLVHHLEHHLQTYIRDCTLIWILGWTCLMSVYDHITAGNGFRV